MNAKLVVVDGEAKSRQYHLNLPTIIGRSRSTDLMLGHPLVSRKHCEVFEANGMLMVRDLGSLNGTFVGETRIAEQAMPVKPGDLLTVGPVTFQAVYRTGHQPLPKSNGWNAEHPTVDAPLPDHLEGAEDPTHRSQREPKRAKDDTTPGDE